MIALVVHEDLCFVFQPAKRRGMDDAVAIALETGACVAFRFLIKPSMAFIRMTGIGHEPLCIGLKIERYHKRLGIAAGKQNDNKLLNLIKNNRINNNKIHQTVIKL
jgi:hypothetical protein